MVRRQVSILDSKGFEVDNNKMNRLESNNNESWYSIWLVWGITMLGLLSLIFGNLWFKIVGVITIIMGLNILFMIAKKRQEDNKNG